MKKQIVFVLIIVLFLSCKKEKKVESSMEVKSVVVSNFIKDIKSLKEIKNPIKLFVDEVMDVAEKKEAINKANIAQILKEAKNYASIVIVVSDHTIIKIDDVKNCKESGAWSTCMPYAKGYIKKGKLVYKEDYCNNIIGTPDSQKRTAYFFK